MVTRGRTALHFASGLGYADIVQLLLDRDADALIIDSYGCSPLHEATTFGHLDVLIIVLVPFSNDIL